MRNGEGAEKAPVMAKQRAVARAFANAYRRRGLLPEKPCAVCGTVVHLEMHHVNYLRPVDVIWLCHAHHRAVHRGGLSVESLLISRPEYLRKTAHTPNKKKRRPYSKIKFRSIPEQRRWALRLAAKKKKEISSILLA